VAQRLLQRRFPGALRPASPHHRHDQGLAPLARCRQLGPPLRAIRRLPPPHWRHLDPQDTCGRRARPLLRALPIARWRSPTLGAAPTPPLRLGLVSGLLEPPLRGQWDPGAAPRCSPRDRGIALQEGGQCLGLDGTWRSLLWPMGVLLLHCRVLRVTHCLLSRSRASRPNTFTGIIGHDPRKGSVRQVCRAPSMRSWGQTRRRRRQRHRMTWPRMDALAEPGLPNPHILHPYPAPRVCVTTRGRRPVRSCRTPGSVRGVPGNWHPYRDRTKKRALPYNADLRHPRPLSPRRKWAPGVQSWVQRIR